MPEKNNNQIFLDLVIEIYQKIRNPNRMEYILYESHEKIEHDFVVQEKYMDRLIKELETYK